MTSQELSLTSCRGGTPGRDDRRLLAVNMALSEDTPASLTGWAGVFTLPNLISFARLACIPWFVWLLFGAGSRMQAALLLAVLGATDWVDGWIARRFEMISDVGKVLDPTADRLLLVVALIGMIVDGSVPTWFAMAVLTREMLVGLAAIILALLGAVRIEVTWWGKTGTFALLIAVPSFLAGESTGFAHHWFAVGGWVFGLPGLLIAWWAAYGYVPLALSALRDGRAARKASAIPDNTV
ncbi:MAG TPA: CDP-diacylglycerol--glycerol-3-phosphate 3-phosphatidyltransferase [Acidimicrobiaceae bacterium]|nr:CDP-diacylglycerol--glycerol-3-phosphate 3-phosphatidyltransferase [Acidimicrobiaceae bacterium]HCV35347.1 CDP-diacylglycerol--glycerol-3-phosphate 3-phosphatidyltransferase [Acidimicrobiaceae bacterium]